MSIRYGDGTPRRVARPLVTRLLYLCFTLLLKITMAPRRLNAKLTVKCSDAPVTALDFGQRLLYAGMAGKIPRSDR